MHRIVREEIHPHLAARAEREEDSWAYLKNAKKILRGLRKVMLRVDLKNCEQSSV